MSQKPWRNVLQAFCQNVAWFPWQLTKYLSDGTETFQEHFTRKIELEKMFPIENNLDLMSGWA